MGVRAYASAVSQVLGRAVPYEGTCLLTMDPATMLPTGEFVENGLSPSGMLRLLEIELREQDLNTWVALRRAHTPAARLSMATGGDLEGSLRHREVRKPAGLGDELRVVLANGTGVWGAMTLFREARGSHFSNRDVGLVASLAGLIADGLRQAALLGGDTASVDAGVVILGVDDSIQMCDRAAWRWLDLLGDGRDRGARLPVAISAVARQVRVLEGAGPVEAPTQDLAPARALLQTPAGWLLVRASLLGDDADTAPVAVTLEAPRAPEIAPVIAAAYGLTTRERRVTELVARGHPTTQIARRLHLSTYTVQDHLKSIFDKTGASSRGDLVARLYVDHYATP